MPVPDRTTVSQCLWASSTSTWALWVAGGWVLEWKPCKAVQLILVRTICIFFLWFLCFAGLRLHHLGWALCRLSGKCHPKASCFVFEWWGSFVEAAGSCRLCYQRPAGCFTWAFLGDQIWTTRWLYGFFWKWCDAVQPVTCLDSFPAGFFLLS